MSMKSIYFVGTPNREKGIDEFHQLALKFQEHRFFWFCFKLDDTVKNLYPKIEFLIGFESDEMKERIKQEMDIFVCCSHFEGFSLPIAEAILLKKPVITYALEEIVDVYEDHIEYVKPFQYDTISDRLQKLIDYGIYQKDLDEARQYVLDNYSPDVVSQRLLNILLENAV